MTPDRRLTRRQSQVLRALVDADTRGNAMAYSGLNAQAAGELVKRGFAISHGQRDLEFHFSASAAGVARVRG